MHKTTIHISRLFLTLLLAVETIAATAAPRLTVVAVVDGMSSESLALLRPYWGKGGLRTLSEEAYQTTVDFPHIVYGGNETTATLMTGTTPSEHGYASDSYYVRRTREPEQLLTDKTVQGIGTKQQLSPRVLLSPTLADKMRIQHGEKAKIFAVGIHPETTILLAGHGANACCWIDTTEMHWATTSFYQGGLPSAADEQNTNGRFAEVANRIWTPRMEVAMYNNPTETERKKSFNYQSATVLCKSPAANTLVVELALAIQKSEQMGTDRTPDMLLLELNTLTPQAHADRIESAEQEDIYLWLNQDLGYLMEQLDKRIGRENYELLVVGRPVLGTSQEAMAKAQLTVQQFNVDRAAALTGTYLMAIYGHERWVDGGFGQSIYLNRTLIEQKRLSLETIERQVANFLMDFEGVQWAYPQHEALLSPQYQTSLTKRSVGDVFFTLQPGWQLMHSEKSTADGVIDAQPQAPLLLWSGSLRAMPTGKLSATDVMGLVE